jgi:hypothetical protein
VADDGCEDEDEDPHAATARAMNAAVVPEQARISA